jgi:hypothetical protein
MARVILVARRVEPMRAFAEELKVDGANSTIIAAISARSYALSFGEATAYELRDGGVALATHTTGRRRSIGPMRKNTVTAMVRSRRANSPKCWLSG